MTTQKITPSLWFDSEAEEAAKFYTSIFKKSRIIHVARYGDAGAEVTGRPKGSVMTVDFELEGQMFMALNGGPIFKFTPAISFLVETETQQELDDLWNKLTAGGQIEQCGWLRDKYGVSWQIVPKILGEMMQDKDPKKQESVMKAMLQMKKIDIEGLKAAYSK
jgi:predicted 3-demethylubiquinone-9 3-methyltransferase (glyoxalase superfamily)